MGDLISRQAAIDVVRRCSVKEVAPAYMLIDKAEVMTELMMLPSAQPEQRWIPCSERLPDNDESVLISNSHGVTKAWWTGKSWTSIAVKNYKTVTAWMPLPEPAKLEND